jgi:hypothetical protein
MFKKFWLFFNLKVKITFPIFKLSLSPKTEKIVSKNMVRSFNNGISKSTFYIS